VKYLKSTSSPNKLHAPPAEYFDELLPFHLVLDKQLRVIQAGHLVTRFLPADWLGRPISELITVKRPLSAKLDIDSFLLERRRLWVCQTDHGLLLRGDWQVFGDKIFFMCTAWVPKLADFESLKLRIDDFPLFESTVEHLFIIQQYEVGLQELEQLGEQLRAQKKLAEQASNAKTSFLATMSHEIRTPMNGILGMTQVLLDSGLTADQREISETIQFSANHLLQIVNDILDFARLEAGRMEISLQPLSLRRIVDESLAICQVPANEKGVLLGKHVPSEALGFFYLDPVRVRQILVNLIGNAVKFTDLEGSVEVNVSVIEDKFRIEVVDTGCGIESAEAEAMFEPFKQADTGSSRRGEGTGLGLAICAKIVQAIDGEIGVNSELGTGSVFWFTLPRVVAEFEDVPQLDGIEDLRLSGIVLLVEDNLVNQKVAEAYLGKVGLDVVTVNNGQEAIDLIYKQQFDLVLMDCHMPVLGGIEATRRLRQYGCEVPIIALTADVLDDAKDACIAAGMNDVITKPVRRQELLSRIRNYFPKYSAGNFVLSRSAKNSS
jgi:signal transduction histidine kinase/CheY-like chemotaxis protein